MMNFGEKLQELRKKKGLTQEQLGEALYVSRTAISKWESGRGYPSIDSLRAIADFFSVTVDELLSSREVLTIAEEEGKQKKKQFRTLVLGLLDLSATLFLFFPFFAQRLEGGVRAVSLLNLEGVQDYLILFYFAIVIGMILFGVLTLVLQSCEALIWQKSKLWISLSLGMLSLLLFVLGLQPYAAIFAFVLLAIKVFLFIKSR